MTQVVTPEVTEVVQKVVEEWTGANRMFTLFDVSKEVQHRCGEANLPFFPHYPKPEGHGKPATEGLHDTVQNAVLPFTGSGAYRRSNQEVGAASSAFVYYPAGADPSQYVPMGGKVAASTATAAPAQPLVGNDPDLQNILGALANASGAPVTATDGTGASATVAPNSGSGALTKDRLNVPPFIVRASGFVAGDTVYVVDEDPAGEVQKPVLVLLKEQPPKSLTEYKVSADSRIRVTPAMLKMGGLEGDTFEFEADNGKIVVKPK